MRETRAKESRLRPILAIARTIGRPRQRASSERDPLALAIGQRIRALRIAAGLTQAQLAQPNYTPGLLANIETGRSLPSLEALAYLANRLERTPRALIPGRLGEPITCT